MKYRNDGYNWVVRLEKGEKLVDCLTQVIKQEKIEGAWLSGLGGASAVELGFYDLPKQTYKWQKFDELMEITSLQGNVAVGDDGEPVIHMHGTFGRADFSAIGGHVKDLVVAGTCEVFLHKWYAGVLGRKHDDAVGLKLLDL